MIDPKAIIKLDDTTVETPDGPEDAVSSVAVWDWDTLIDDGIEMLEMHTNDGDMYVEADDVLDIISVEESPT